MNWRDLRYLLPLLQGSLLGLPLLILSLVFYSQWNKEKKSGSRKF